MKIEYLWLSLCSVHLIERIEYLKSAIRNPQSEISDPKL
ncbi:hypothetical protein D1AOALGA4SA_7342 [Olavius algarvensis Delta 1 endosymbiont]|nr:hypothetical protein D1AOALGA4SA_7342 [Olavius algarvensis Delta 1 endosymbiont]